MYMYRRNRCLSFELFFALANRRASPAHDGIVRSSIPYGAYLLAVTFASRSVRGSRLSGIGYANVSFCVVVAAAGGCSACGANVRYSSFHLGGRLAVPVRFGM